MCSLQSVDLFSLELQLHRQSVPTSLLPTSLVPGSCNTSLKLDIDVIAPIQSKAISSNLKQSKALSRRDRARIRSYVDVIAVLSGESVPSSVICANPKP